MKLNTAAVTQSSICISLIKEKKKWQGAQEERDLGRGKKNSIVRSGWGFPPLERAALHLEMSA